jgi:hypothetical protein
MQWHLLGLVSLIVQAQAMSEADPDKDPTGILLQCADEKPLPLLSFLSRSKKVPSIYSNWVIF